MSVKKLLIKCDIVAKKPESLSFAGRFGTGSFGVAKRPIDFAYILIDFFKLLFPTRGEPKVIKLIFILCPS